MHMTLDEMRVFYKDSKDKKVAVEVLADMNLVSKAEIRRMLSLPANSKDKKEKKVNGKEYTNWTPELVGDLRRLYFEERLAIAEIAERMGLDYKAVHYKIGAIKKMMNEECGMKNEKSPAKEQSADASEKVCSKSQENEKSAEGIYIKQLEELLAEKTEEVEKLRKRIAFLEKLLKEKDQVMPEVLQEIYEIADCIGALEMEALVYSDSVKRLASYIMDICIGEQKRAAIVSEE